MTLISHRRTVSRWVGTKPPEQGIQTVQASPRSFAGQQMHFVRFMPREKSASEEKDVDATFGLSMLLSRHFSRDTVSFPFQGLL